MHTHDHSHAGHHHHHEVPVTGVSSAFIIGIVLNSLYVVAQAIAGIATHSMALLADAGHNLSDVASLGLSLLAFRLAKSRPSAKFTYGYKKTTILAALVNAVVLFITIGVLGYESIHKLLHPQPIQGGIVAVVAGVGILVNFGSAMLFFRNREHDLNTRGAYLHLLTDALVSLGVVVAGVVIKFTNWYWLDGAVSIVVLVVILFGTWSLLMHSLRLSLDAVPNNIDMQKIATSIKNTHGVEDMHHLHIWAMSTTQNALTLHLTLNEQLTFNEKMKLVREIKHELYHNNIQHATIELESASIPCADNNC